MTFLKFEKMREEIKDNITDKTVFDVHILTCLFLKLNAIMLEYSLCKMKFSEIAIIYIKIPITVEIVRESTS